MEQRSGKGSPDRPERLRPVRRKTREEVKRGLADPSWVHQEQEAGQWMGIPGYDMIIEWASARVPPTPLWGGPLRPFGFPSATQPL